MLLRRRARVPQLIEKFGPIIYSVHHANRLCVVEGATVCGAGRMNMHGIGIAATVNPIINSIVFLASIYVVLATSFLILLQQGSLAIYNRSRNLVCLQ